MSVQLIAAQQVATATMTAGRVWSLVGVLLGVAGIVVGLLAKRRAVRRWTVAAVVAGLLGMVIGGLVVAAAEGGPGTGYGIVGGYLSLIVGLAATVVGGLAARRHRTAA